jgi:2-oxoisovalerate dehydrogenase E2 component (dihydrolipoyl transacylase)
MGVRRFLLPDLGEGLEEAEVVAWRVREGDRVELNQVLVEVNTAKALVEVPSPWAGVVEHLHAAEGEVVRVGQPLVSILVDGEVEGGPEAPPEAARGEAGEVPRRRPVLVGYGVEEEPSTGGAAAPAGFPERPGPAPTGLAGPRERPGPVPASPTVRRLARELGVNLASVTRTGPGGRVTREDVLAAHRALLAAEARARPAAPEAPPPAEAGPEAEAAPVTEAGAATRIPLRGVRRLVAERMARSATEIPQVTTFLTLDATALQAFREELAREAGRRVGPLPVVVRALAEVCGEFPSLNASFDAGRQEIVLHHRCHVGIATDTERGLLVPVVRDVQDRGILEVAEAVDRLVGAARAGTIGPHDLRGSTVTVTNVGTFGAEFGTPLVNPPEAAILALGVIEPRPLVVEGAVQVRPAATLALSFDHRVLDGAEAGRALAALRDLLQSPARLRALPR